VSGTFSEMNQAQARLMPEAGPATLYLRGVVCCRLRARAACI